MNLITQKGVLSTVLPLPNLSSDYFSCDYFNRTVSRSKGRREADQLVYSSLKLLLEQLHFYQTQLESTTSNLSKRIEELSILKKVSDARRALNSLKNQKLDPRDLEIVVSEVERLEKLTSQILEYSKETKLSLSKHDLNRIIEETLKVLKERLKFSNIQLKTEFSKDIREVKLDPQRIKQVLFNLIDNAIEAMPQGGRLTITTKKKKESVKLEIEDTCKGIPDEKI